MKGEDTNVIRFTNGDPRIETLMQSLEDVVYERGQGLQLATIIGAIDLLKIQLLEDMKGTTNAE